MHQIKLITPAGETDIEVGELLTSRLGELDPAPVLLVDEQVMVHHHHLFRQYPCISVPSGEANKTLQTVENIYRELVRMEVDRTALLVGIGGGLTTDVAGFVAATFLREIRFGFISTTLLGQVDASIGGKNGVNLDGYKNMIGTIRQPSFVWCDLSLLGTLERREYISGIAEVVKYGVIRDINLLHYLKDHMTGLLGLESDVVSKVVAASAAIKVEVVQKDEKESGLRRILNFGHTIGHAIERDQKVLHGEAVSMGMVLAARFSNMSGLLPGTDVDLVTDLLRAGGLPVEMSLDPERIFDNIRKDKKKSGGNIHFVLIEGLGNAVVKNIPLSDLKQILYDLC